MLPTSWGCRTLHALCTWSVLQAACTWSSPLPVSPVILAMVDVFYSKVQIFCYFCRTTQQGRQRTHDSGYKCCEQKWCTQNTLSDAFQAASTAWPGQGDIKKEKLCPSTNYSGSSQPIFHVSIRAACAEHCWGYSVKVSASKLNTVASAQRLKLLSLVMATAISRTSEGAMLASLGVCRPPVQATRWWEF